MPAEPYYRDDLARIHHLAFGFHAKACAPGILSLLAGVRERGGLVLEIGCGSGLLTRQLVEAGHRVLATDASPAMLEIARGYAGEAEGFSCLRLPSDPIPSCDAVVSVGHVLSYLAEESEVFASLSSLGEALRPEGVLLVDICDLSFGEKRASAPGVWRGEDWLLVTEYSRPLKDRFVRELTSFTRERDGRWRRDDERHVNVLVDTEKIPPLLASGGLRATLSSRLGEAELPAGLVAVTARRS